MHRSFFFKLAVGLVAGAVMAACGPAQTALPATAPNDTPAPAAPAAATSTLAPTRPQPPTPSASPTATALPPEVLAITPDCTDGAQPVEGEFRAENNTWGKGDLAGWTQCIGLAGLPDGALAARWTWDWPKAGDNIKAYPEIIFGQKPGGPSTTAALPLVVNAVRSAKIDYVVSSTHTGDLNLAFDIWLTSTANPVTFAAPPITHEIMIWIDRDGMAPGGRWRETVEIGGATYLVYTADNWGDGWRYVAFMSKTPQTGAGSLDVALFLAYMKEKQLASGAEYLASIEFGNEVAFGTGETALSRYEITIVPAQ